jgi:GTP cyclohydrolase II
MIDHRHCRFYGAPQNPGPSRDSWIAAEDLQPSARRRASDRSRLQPVVRRSVSLPVVLMSGTCVWAKAVSFGGIDDDREHLAVTFAPPDGNSTSNVPLVRIHSECLTGDVFGSARCDCGPQLREAIELVAPAGGIILYLRQEGRGIGLYNKLDAYSLQDDGMDTFTANHALSFADDLREYKVAAQMLSALDVLRIRLLTNNYDKVIQLADSGIDVVEVIPTEVHLNEHNATYLSAKRYRAGHNIRLPDY